MTDTQPPPQNIQSEQVVICSMMFNPDIIPDVVDRLSPDDFYLESHQHIVQVIYKVRSRDLLTISTELQRLGLHEKTGGDAYLGKLSEITSVWAGWEYHAGIIEEMAERRRVINQCTGIAERCHNQREDLDEILSDAQHIIPHQEQKSDYTPNLDLVNKAFKVIEERSKNEHKVGLLTGFKEIDANISGLEPKCTYYIKAESGTGKSAFAINIAENVATGNDGTVLFFTLESTDLAITFRRMARRSGIALTRIRTGNLKNDGEWEDLTRVSDELADSNMVVIENSRFRHFENIQTFCHSFSQNKNLLLIVIDFLQLLRSKSKQPSRHLELSYISDMCNYLAKDLDCPIMVLSQVNAEYKTKESRDIENNADNVWELRRDNKESESAELNAVKGKDTGTWKCWLKFTRS